MSEAHARCLEGQVETLSSGQPIMVNWRVVKMKDWSRDYRGRYPR